MKTFLSLVILCVASLPASLAAHADTVNGSLSFSLTGVHTNPSRKNLISTAGITQLTWSGAQLSQKGIGDLSVVPYRGANLSGNNRLILAGPNGGTRSTPFTLIITKWGTFTASNDFNFGFASFGGSNFVSGSFDGYFTPISSTFSAALGTNKTYTPQEAVLALSFTQPLSGSDSYSGSGTLTTPSALVEPSPVPEPSSLALLGTALIASVGALRLRLKA